MNKYKFRGLTITKDKQGKRQWIYGDLITVKKGRAFILPEDFLLTTAPLGNSPDVHEANVVLVEVDPETVGRYVQIEDKNNRKIYEGDIVKLKLTIEKYNKDGYFEDKKVVETIKVIKTPSILETWEKYWEGHLNIFVESVEVIGNIYEDAELLREV